MGNLKDALEGSYTETEYNDLMDVQHEEMLQLHRDYTLKIAKLEGENSLLKALLLAHGHEVPVTNYTKEDVNE